MAAVDLRICQCRRWNYAAKDYDSKSVTNDVTKNEEITTAFLAKRFGRDVRTIKRDMKVLQELGLVVHIGPSNGGYWKRLK